MVKEQDYYSRFAIDDQERELFTNVISKNDDLEQILINEVVAPSMYGHEYIKQV